MNKYRAAKFVVLVGILFVEAVVLGMAAAPDGLGGVGAVCGAIFGAVAAPACAALLWCRDGLASILLSFAISGLYLLFVDRFQLLSNPFVGVPTYMTVLALASLFIPKDEYRAKRMHDICVHCGYSTIGLPSGRCPECGLRHGERATRQSQSQTVGDDSP